MDTKEPKDFSGQQNPIQETVKRICQSCRKNFETQDREERTCPTCKADK